MQDKTEAKHTPRPWRVGSIEFGDDSRARIVSEVAKNISELGRTLAWVSAPIIPRKAGEADVEYVRRRNEMVEANASLIAAAPDLLAALVDATRRLEKCASMNGTDAEFAAELVRPYSVVIAKARGQQ